jgi:hypothetical protein
MPTQVQKPLRKAGNQVPLLIFGLFPCSVVGYGSESAFTIRIRIQDSQIIADPDTQH